MVKGAYPLYLTYENLTLRDALPEDAGQLAAWWNDGSVMAHAGFPKGLGTTPEKVRQELGQSAERHRLILEIGGTAVGESSYRTCAPGTAEIGIKICETASQEKGYGKKFLSLLLRTLFQDLGYEKVRLDTGAENRRAQHVYERLGFRKLRVREKAFIDQLGRPMDAVDYELLPQDFHSFL